MSNADAKLTQDLQLLCQQQEDELANLREYCEILRVSNNSNTQAFMETLAHTERDLEQLQITNSLQHQALQTCKDNLIQPLPMPQLADSEIITQYEILFQQVSHWVDLEIFKFENKSGYPENDTRAIIDGGYTSIERLLNSASGAGDYLPCAVIHTHIQRTFFGEDVILFGLDPCVTKFLHDVEEHMAMLKPRRDTIAIDTWRSETLNAISTMPEAIQSKDSMVREFTEDLFHNLQKIFPGLGDDPQSKLRLCHDVLGYTVQLEASIHQSSTEYRFWPVYEQLGCLYAPFTIADMTGITCIDVETRKTLKPDSPVIPDSDGFIGRRLLLVEPGLERYDKSKKKTITLRQPQYLVQLHTPLAKRTG